MDEITAEYAVAGLADAAPLRIRLRTTWATKTDLGRVRENNEDKVEVLIPDADGDLATRGQVFLICDGMGGHEAGQIASELAANTFVDVYRHFPNPEPQAAATAAVIAANRYVVDVARAVPSRRGMGTTLSALMLVQDQAIVAQVGDSRVYRLRDGGLTPLTTDHTWVEEVVRTGVMARADAEVHPYRHMLQRAIGADATVEPDVFTYDLRAGDRFFICSDGVTNHVADDEIARILADFGPSEGAWRTVALARQGGGSDNATVAIIHVEELIPVA